MTAPVGDEVERTFSRCGRFSTGLSRLETHEPGRQDRRDFGDLGGAISLFHRV